LLREIGGKDSVWEIKSKGKTRFCLFPSTYKTDILQASFALSAPEMQRCCGFVGLRRGVG
jgi:hypothetical protein